MFQTSNAILRKHHEYGASPADASSKRKCGASRAQQHNDRSDATGIFSKEKDAVAD